MCCKCTGLQTRMQYLAKINIYRFDTFCVQFQLREKRPESDYLVTYS